MTLHYDDMPKTPEDFDKFFRADIPDKDNEEELYIVVAKHMPHICIKDVCLFDEKCRFDLRFDFCDKTTQPPYGKVLWKRPNNRRTIIKKQKRSYLSNRSYVTLFLWG